jgi:hypothetical protein
MAQSPVAVLSKLGRPTLGVFRGVAAERAGVSRKQLHVLLDDGIVARVFPDTYRMTVVDPSDGQRLWAALLWAGDGAAGAGRSAGGVYALEGVRATKPEIVVDRDWRGRNDGVIVYRASDFGPLMLRRHRGFPVTGVEATLVRLAHLLDAQALEIACEDARRRRLTGIPSLYAYLERFARPGQRGVASMRALLAELDPVHAARSTLEVITRRLLVAHDVGGFQREFPLVWNGTTYRYDFGFPRSMVILETNGRLWHDDSSDYERDHEKWSVPARLGYRLVLATWAKVTADPGRFLAELGTALAA